MAYRKLPPTSTPVIDWLCGFVHLIVSLRDIIATRGLLSSRRHVRWHDSVSVGVKCQSCSKTECALFFRQKFLCLLRSNDEPQEWRNNCLRLQPCSVSGSSGVVLLSWKVNFHVVSDKLCRIQCASRHRPRPANKKMRSIISPPTPL